MYVEAPPSVDDLLRELPRERVLELITNSSSTTSNAGEYLHWDKVRHLPPPDGLSHREWWLALKLSRHGRPLPLTDPKTSKPFTFMAADPIQRLQHFVDQTSGGAIAMPEVVIADEQARRHYLVNSLMEEAIRSSQLEGARTSRRVAKELLQSGRPPRDRSERMIINNYRASQFMRETIDRADLAPDHVLELQRILTEGTLDNPDVAGRLQRPDEERVVVMDVGTGEVLHVPPPAELLPDRLEAMCRFANSSGDDEDFLHPVVRSILLHFWIGYDHPFEDGNGRTARIIFYWSMRKHGYWLTEYLSISKILRQAPSKYVRSFLMSETDGGDTTHFVLYQLGVVKRAVEELHTYLGRKIKEVRKVEAALKGADHFNHRQLALISDAIRNPEHIYTHRSHATSHNVTEETARADLNQLLVRNLLTRRKSGRQYVFVVPSDLSDTLTARANGKTKK
jgi:Fic family protein